MKMWLSEYEYVDDNSKQLPWLSVIFPPFSLTFFLPFFPYNNSRHSLSPSERERRWKKSYMKNDLSASKSSTIDGTRFFHHFYWLQNYVALLFPNSPLVFI